MAGQPLFPDPTDPTDPTDSAVVLPDHQPSTPSSAVRVDHCYIEHRCDMPGCAGRGSQFAIDMRHGWTLAHYCDAHTTEEIQYQWRELMAHAQHAPTPEADSERIEAFFRDLVATDAADAHSGAYPHLDQRRPALPAPVTPENEASS